jgi:hypothetical protein
MLGFWWKQYAYAQSDQWTKLCNALGARLDAGHETYAATWCYICAGNVEKAVDIWARTLNVRNGGVDFVDLLQVRGGCSFKDHQKCRLAMHRWSLDCNAWLISEIT